MVTALAHGGQAPDVRLVAAAAQGRFVADTQQQRVLQAEARVVVVLGPAGSGKTALLAELLAGAAGDGLPVLGSGPDRRSVGRLADTVAARVAARSDGASGGSGPRGAMRIATTHALALDLVALHAQVRGTAPPRLLTATDSVAVLADVLAESRDSDWPQMYRQAVRTRGFAERTKDFLARAAMHGWNAAGLVSAAQAGAPPVWASLAKVWRRYHRVLDLAGAMDYPDLMARATSVAERSGRPAPAVLAVDEAVDLDPQQWRLLAAMAGAGGRVVLAADPDQATNAFRGGTGGTLMPMAEAIAGRDGLQVVALTRSYRCGGPVLRAVQQIHHGLPMVGVPAAAVRVLRAAEPAAGSAGASVRTYPDARAEATAVAEAVRRFCLAGQGPPRWQDAAVLVRTGSAIGPLEQALALAGVPVCVVESHRTVLQDPVAAVLVRALAWAAHLAGQAVPAPEPAQVLEVLQSGLVGAEPAAVRAAAVRLEPAERATARAVPRRPRSAAELLADAVAEPAALAGPPALVRFARRLSRSREQLAAGAPVAHALWTLWSGEAAGPGPWALRLQAAALGADAESTAAHAALDAVLALFDEADRTQARGGAAGVLAFLDAVRDLRVPVPGPRPGQRAVALMTAHAAKGGQWEFVVVAGAQEGLWPAAGGGIGLLGEELLADIDAPTEGLRHAFVADERRLFASACARARRQLLVTAVEAGDRDPDGGRPSRFVSDLGLPVMAGAPAARRSTAAGVVVALRRAVTDPRTPAEVAGRAAGLLHALREDPAFPGADPRHWWGLAAPTEGVRPIWSADRPLGMTVTGLAEAASCPRRWFATRVLRAVPVEASGASVGLLLHRINEAWARGELVPALDAAEDALARSWPLLPFDAPWQSAQRRGDIRAALVRLLAWHRQHSDRIAFSEEPFEMDVEAGAWGTVRLRGKADLGVVMTGQGLAVLDLKSARNGPSSAEVAAHVQLAGYQRAVAAGALPAAGTPARPAGAGLLLPALPDSAGSEQPKVLWQPPMQALEDPEHPGPGTVAGFDRLVAQVAGQMRRESFPAVPSAACRTCPIRSWCPAKQPGAVREPVLEGASC